LREVFNDYIPDVWIHTDHYKKGQCGDQPGYTVSLTAETTTGIILTKDFNFGNKKEFILPEDLAQRCAYGMLDEIYSGGCIDSTNQSIALLLMALSTGDNVSQIKIGRVTQQSVMMLRNLKKFFNINFKIEECQEDGLYDTDSDDEPENDKNSEQGEDE
jgi:RNA 3'-terminal phosphate cyclase-like protein|tara:strand:- start:125 stop:601 length:477 start_codon:yes stop_codon:yes gene_type:complete